MGRCSPASRHCGQPILEIVKRKFCKCFIDVQHNTQRCAAENLCVMSIAPGRAECVDLNPGPCLALRANKWLSGWEVAGHLHEAFFDATGGFNVHMYDTRAATCVLEDFA